MLIWFFDVVMVTWHVPFTFTPVKAPRLDHFRQSLRGRGFGIRPDSPTSTSESTVRHGRWPLLGGFEPRTFCANQHAAVPPPVSGFTSKHKTPPSFQKPCIYPTKKMDEMEWILSNMELILLSFTLTWNLWACKWRAGTILIFFLLMFHCFNCKHIYTNDEMEFSNVMKCFTPNWSV